MNVFSSDQAPFLFIKVEKEDEEEDSLRFVVDDRATEILQKIQKPIVVVCIAGAYRTGKSFVANCLAGRKSKKSFVVGSTVEACTRGIWMRSVDRKELNLDKFPHLKDTAVFVMDCEGLGSTQADATYDVKIFSLSLLLSSYFIYNSVGSLDESQIDRLGLVVQTTEYIRVHPSTAGDAQPTVDAGGGGSSLRSYFPSFLWLLRDFTLELVVEGKQITPKEYLDRAIAPVPVDPKKKSAAAAVGKNLTRATLHDYFLDRQCFVMVRPVEAEEQLQALDGLPLSALRPEFQRQLHEFQELVYAAAEPKKLQGVKLNGPLFLSLADNYLGAVNQQSFLTISSAWDNVVAVQCQKALAAARAQFASGLLAATEGRVLEAGELQAACRQVEKGALELFRSMAVGEDVQLHCEDLQREWDEQVQAAAAANAAASVALCQSLLADLTRTLQAMLTDPAARFSQSYDTCGALTLKVNAAVATYHGKAKGPEKDALLVKHLCTALPDVAGRLQALCLGAVVQEYEQRMLGLQVRAEEDVARANELFKTAQGQLAHQAELKAFAERQLQTTLEEVEYYRREVQALKAEREDMEEKLRAGEGRERTLQVEIEGLVNARTSLHARLDEKDSEREALKKDIQALSGSGEELKLRMAQKSKEQDEYRARMEGAVARKDAERAQLQENLERTVRAHDEQTRQMVESASEDLRRLREQKLHTETELSSYITLLRTVSVSEHVCVFITGTRAILVYLCIYNDRFVIFSETLKLLINKKISAFCEVQIVTSFALPFADTCIKISEKDEAFVIGFENHFEALLCLEFFLRMQAAAQALKIGNMRYGPSSRFNVVEIYENQKRKTLLHKWVPSERLPWSDARGEQPMSKEDVPLPTAPPGEPWAWEWASDWKVDRDAAGAHTDLEGFCYAYGYDSEFHAECTPLDFVRRRRHLRKCVSVFNKAATKEDFLPRAQSLPDVYEVPVPHREPEPEEHAAHWESMSFAGPSPPAQAQEGTGAGAGTGARAGGHSAAMGDSLPEVSDPHRAPGSSAAHARPPSPPPPAEVPQALGAGMHNGHDERPPPGPPKNGSPQLAPLAASAAAAAEDEEQGIDTDEMDSRRAAPAPVPGTGRGQALMEGWSDDEES